MRRKLRVYIRDDSLVYSIKSYSEAYVNEAIDQACQILQDHVDTLGVARHKTEYTRLINKIRDIKTWEYR